MYSPFYSPEPPHADDIAQRGTKAWRQAVNAHRAWLGNELWSAQARQNLNLSNMDAVRAFLGTRGVTNEIGGGRHALRLFTGDLGEEGFGMGFRGIPHAMEAYMPDWKFNLDRAIQGGMPRGDANSRFMPWGQPTAPNLGGTNMPGMTPGAMPGATPGTSPLSPQVPGLTLGTMDDDDEWRRRLGL